MTDQPPVNRPVPAARSATSPPSNLRSLQDRLRNAARNQGALFGRLQRQLSALVVTEMLTRVKQPISGPPLLVKGGTALEFRLGLSASRTSKDLDAVVRGDLADFVSRAAEAVKIPWAGFSGRVTRQAEADIPGLAVKPRRFEVKLSYHNKPFATVPRRDQCR
ncbi:nucleotidyl transferase AbiEii/AbiGii toxin family protein [Micromonospora soli]|uniref:nucleotidyl transferase AbiEii/AbiGii toxin family protein n=1 Tax=Micromonospora sp. NBRC 110009 TaxID=3061627 RepID=UPI00267176E3|nr:nucleotidyl transferase AbiEii/AbiGii toxin family protein [Micromonospora sp. NBRC 110009]WKT99911.1 nucleotidyl transferase AbiEii/AbiGii toxin family protein [Micromonospora sp. NBRC 110009]